MMLRDRLPLLCQLHFLGYGLGAVVCFLDHGLEVDYLGRSFHAEGYQVHEQRDENLKKGAGVN